MLTRSLLLVLLSLTAYLPAGAKNYIRYHQRSLVVQEQMLKGEHNKALELLHELEKRYGLMPTETFARALCQVAIGDTASARVSYLKSIEQRASLGWLFISTPQYSTAADSLWYENVVAECEALWLSFPQFVDGPNPGMPTLVSHLNARHQFVIDSLGWFDPATQPEAQFAYDAVVEQHDLLLDSIISGKLPVPSIATYGVNLEFETFVIHCSSKLTKKKQKHFKRWLKQGLIYPRVYATCFDDLANEEGRPIPYGIFNGLRPEELVPGHEKRRAAIGMGGDHMDKLRFHWGG
ncbi:MAG: hypothetical protein KA230_05685 [Flavobacteriales bacterium]|nr:hypothetical protein [Flavobacteriales bacterium]